MEYFENIENAISLINKEISVAQINLTDEFDEFDFSGYIHNLNQILRQLLRFKAANRFMKIDLEDFTNGSSFTVGQKVITTHVVKDFETPLSIAKKYSLDLSEILILNDITVEDIKAGKELKVYSPNTRLYEIYQDIPTFGSQKGLQVLGRDFPNDLQAGKDGDLLSLGPIETLQQGVENRIMTRKGNYPLDDTFGLDNINKLGFPQDIADALLTVYLTEQLERDPRIRQIDDLSIKSNRDQKTFQIQARTITNNMLRVNKA
ncbi:MAG: LysM peptidoglycan-binding domain-containing protein [Bacillota bacterium]